MAPPDGSGARALGHGGCVKRVSVGGGGACRLRLSWGLG